MRLDYQNEFCESLTVGAASATGSTNVILVGKNAGAGEQIQFKVWVETAAVGGTSIQCMVRHCATAGGTYLDLMSTSVYVTASMTAGFDFKVPNLPAEHEQYLDLEFNAIGAFSACAVSGYLTRDNQTNKYMQGRSDLAGTII